MTKQKLGQGASGRQKLDDHLMLTGDSQRLLKAMRATGDALTPSANTKLEAWEQVARAMAARPASSFSAKRHGAFAEFFWRFLLPGVAAAAIVLLGVTLIFLPAKNSEYTVLASKGTSAIVVIEDFSSDSPVIIEELKNLGLVFEFHQDLAERVVIVQVPNPPPVSLVQWASRWDILPPEPGEWRLKIVPKTSPP